MLIHDSASTKFHGVIQLSILSGFKQLSVQTMRVGCDNIVWLSSNGCVQGFIQSGIEGEIFSRMS